MISIIKKVLKSNIFIFFIIGTILAIINWNMANKDNFSGTDAIFFIFLTIEITIWGYIPFLLSVILNLIIKFSKKEIVKKIFKIIMIITNVLSFLYLGYIAFLFAAVASMVG